MKMTLLEIVQNILSALDSDEVNDINDTVESAQVAEIVKETFYEQFNNIDVPGFKTLIQLTGVSSTSSPNYLKYNSSVKDIEWIRYQDYRDFNRYHLVSYLEPQDFLAMVLDYTASTDHIMLTTDPTSGVQYYIKTNSCPTYYTSFDDSYIAFDSYDSTYDTTLQASKSISYGTTVPTFSMTNSFVPPLPDNLFPLLLSEAKSVAFINQKQISSTKEEQRAHRQRIRMQNDQFKSRQQQRRHIADAPDYSRRRP